MNATNLQKIVKNSLNWLKKGMQRLQAWGKRNPKKAVVVLILLVIWLFCLPRPLFDTPYSVILFDRNGDLLGARIATDGQWRFPAKDTLPDKYVQCLVAFEDKRFYWHPGVDPIGMGRAFWQNIQAKGVVSGGSTLTMQVIRMSKGNPTRTVFQKILELFMATRLELGYSKREILSLYAAHAPYGGNVVGLEAASWRYYAKRPELLTWAESATLAVLPNSPALIHPGRSREQLLNKRNRLLARLRDAGVITTMECELAQSETLPEAPHPLPQLAPHLLDYMAGSLSPKNQATFKENGSKVSVDRFLQAHVSDILTRRQEVYKGNGIHNIAAIVIDVRSGEIVAYAGNVPNCGKEHGEDVDMVRAPRSTGSILKPYLYASALQSGDILPHSLLHDVPTRLGDYQPENFYERYDGVVPANRALVRSLNVPFVLLLQAHGLPKFHYELQQLGLTTIRFAPEHYGLTLILGGAEATLLDITNTYACMARRLGSFYDRNGKSGVDDFRPARFLKNNPSTIKKEVLTNAPSGLSPGAIWHTFLAMQDVERPNSLGEWENFQASRRVAWKTGTSYGFRDAWAAGTNARYAVGVWVGNADGEGRPGLLGVDMAAPILFEIFEQLPGGDAWFDPPYDDMVQIPVCRQSGFRASNLCEADTVWVPKSGLQSQLCPYHQLLHLDAGGQWQVTSNCESPMLMVHKPWFVLPPAEEAYYRSKTPSYSPPPPYRSDCIDNQQVVSQNPLQLIYPRQRTQIYVPIDLDGKLSSTIFEATHRNKDMEVYWHLDDQYIGATRYFHQMALQPTIGKHRLTLVDKEGFRYEEMFEIVGKSQ